MKSAVLVILLVIAISLPSLIAPKVANAAATDTSDNCPIGYVANSSFDSTGLGISTGNCIPISALGTTGVISNSQVLASSTAQTSVCDADMNSWRAFFTVACWGPLISATLGAALVFVASWVLTVAGVLFNWALNDTVLQFGQLVNGTGGTGSIINAINLAWSVFRDLSNILIIGMFIFIAVNIILGNKNYGEKKLIARVLIVAVLINFSLLFSKIIIDGSNYIATQFYTAVSAQDPADLTVNTSTSVGFTTSSNQQAGVAGAFMKYAGVKGFGDTSQAIFSLSKNPGSNSWIGLLFGIMTALLFLVAALVLFYGTFLLVTRAILLLFLMITASLAFASYLIPSISSSDYGWSAWWKALFRNAVFAPLLIIMLWITVTISKAIQVQNGSLGDLIANPTKLIDISALFGYIFIIGLLFLAIKASSSFAGQAAGLSVGSGLFEKFTSGAIFQGGRVNDYFRGRRAATKQETSLSEAQQARSRAAQARLSAGLHADAGNDKLAKFAARQAQQFDKLAATKARSAAKFGEIANKKIGDGDSYADKIKKQGNEVAKIAEKTEPGREEKDRVRQEAEANFEGQREEGRATREAMKKNAEESRKQIEELVGAERKTADQTAQAIEKQASETKETIKLTHDTAMAELSKQVAQGGPNANDAQQKLNDTLARRKTELAEQDNRINQARENLSSTIKTLEQKQFEIPHPNGGTVKTTLNEARGREAESQKELSNWNERTRVGKQEIGERTTKAFNEGGRETTYQIAKKEVSRGDVKRVADAATKKFRDKTSNRGRLREALREDLKEDES